MSDIDTCNIEVAAQILHMHPKTVSELIEAGAIPAGRPGRKTVMFKADVYEYLRKLIARQTAERLGPGPRPKRRSHKRQSPKLGGEVAAS